MYELKVYLRLNTHLLSIYKLVPCSFQRTAGKQHWARLLAALVDRPASSVNLCYFGSCPPPRKTDTHTYQRHAHLPPARPASLIPLLLHV